MNVWLKFWIKIIGIWALCFWLEVGLAYKEICSKFQKLIYVQKANFISFILDYWRFKWCQSCLQLLSYSSSSTQLSPSTFNPPLRLRFKLWFPSKPNFKDYFNNYFPMSVSWKNKSKLQKTLMKRFSSSRMLLSQKDKAFSSSPRLSFLLSTFLNKAVRRWPISKKFNFSNSSKMQECKSTNLRT